MNTELNTEIKEQHEKKEKFVGRGLSFFSLLIFYFLAYLHRLDIR